MPHSGGAGDALATANPGLLVEDRARAFATDLARLGLPCGIDVLESVAFVVPAATGAEDRLTDPELRQAVMAVGRAHGFPRVALVFGDD